MKISIQEISHLIPVQFDPKIFHTLENLKHEGWILQTESNSIKEQAWGVQLQIFCRFHRSRNATISNKRSHPEFEEYALHYLFSDCEKHNSAAHHLLMDGVQAPARQRIAYETSYWE